MLSLREVDVAGDTVPGLAIVVAFVMVVASIMVLVLYVHHIGQSLRVSALIELVGGKTRTPDGCRVSHRLDQDAPRDERRRPARRAVRGGTSIDRDALVELARQADCALEVVPALGEFVPAGAPLVRVTGSPSALDRRRSPPAPST